MASRVITREDGSKALARGKLKKAMKEARGPSQQVVYQGKNYRLYVETGEVEHLFMKVVKGVPTSLPRPVNPHTRKGVQAKAGWKQPPTLTPYPSPTQGPGQGPVDEVM